MKRKIIKNVMIASTLVVAMGTAQAELSSIQAQVIADQKSMENMNADQRRDFRKQIFGNSDKAAQHAYNHAYKAMVEANMMPQLSDVGKPSIEKKSNVANRAIGTSIQYDSGAIENTNEGLASQTVANKFNTGWNPGAGASGAINPVLASGSITAITVNMGSTAGSAAFMTIVNGTGTGGSVVESVSRPVTPGMNTIAVTVATAGPFLGGVWQDAGGTGGGDVVAVATGTTNGQGYHAVQFNDIVVTDFADIAGRNAVFRVQGSLLADTVPVELMNFSVE